MRTLILMRHAKTERSNPAGDHARALAPRGQTDAVLVAQFLKANRFMPEMALVSDATRTRQTIAHMQPEFAPPCEIVFSKKLYLAAPETILHEIWSAPDNLQTLLVLGHNPGMHSLAFALAQEGPRKLRDELSQTYPTAAAAMFAFDTGGWADLRLGACTMTGFVTAKSLRSDHPAAKGGDAG